MPTISRRMRYSILHPELRALIDRKFASDPDRRHVRYNVLEIECQTRDIDVRNEAVVGGRLVTVEQSTVADGPSDDR